MLERTQVFVDTSYLLASFYNSWDEPARAQLEIDLQEVCNVLDRIIVQHVGQPIQRQNWYDGIPDSGPHKYQRTLRTMDGVLLRAGLLIETGQRRTQKAVDTRLVADMVLAAVRQQCTDMVLVSGDQDMIPGVVEATNMGIRVHLLGFSWESMSTALRHKCDTVTILDPRDDFAECMQIQPLEGPIPPQIPPRVYSDETFVNRRVRTTIGEATPQDGPLSVPADGTSADACASPTGTASGLNDETFRDSNAAGEAGVDAGGNALGSAGVAADTPGDAAAPGGADATAGAETPAGASASAPGDAGADTPGAAAPAGACAGGDGRGDVATEAGTAPARAETSCPSPGDVAHRIHSAATAASSRVSSQSAPIPAAGAFGSQATRTEAGADVSPDAGVSAEAAPESGSAAADPAAGAGAGAAGADPAVGANSAAGVNSVADAAGVGATHADAAAERVGGAAETAAEGMGTAAGATDAFVDVHCGAAENIEDVEDKEESPRPSPATMAEKMPTKPRPNPSMMAPRRRPQRRYFPLASEIWSSNGFQTPHDVGQQYAIWWFNNVATVEDRDNAHLLSGGGLPPHVDRPLLQFACEVLHEYTLNDHQRVSLRDGFHQGIRGILTNGVEPRINDRDDDERGRP